MLVGDFNVVLHNNERSGNMNNDVEIDCFTQLVADLQLIDLSLHGLSYA